MTDDSGLRIATRSSELALRQARLVADALGARGTPSTLVTFRTTGDRNTEKPLGAIGAKGLFTHELETALLKRRVDCCVHSLKDLPTEMPAGLAIAAVLEREDPRDVLVVNDGIAAEAIADLPRGSRVGTSSLRRRAQLLARRHDLEVVELRGNVPTRLKKVDDGHVHAAILAAAGLHRLGVSQRISTLLEAPDWLPAAGQGAIAIQIRADDEATRAVVAPLAASQTMLDTRAERAFLGALEGGCQVPIGALSAASETGRTLWGMLSDVSGRRVVRGQMPLDLAEPELTGVRLANELRHRGGNEILDSLRRAQHLPAPQPE